MSVLLLLGAGASYGSVKCHPYCPPLGKDLFAELLTMSDVARRVPSHLREKFSPDFELGMAALAKEWENHQQDVWAFVRDMALYFVQFQPKPGNAYYELGRGIAKSKAAVAIATTNYEMMINTAIDCQNNYRALPQPGVTPLLKIHGSIHYLPDLPEGLRFEGLQVARSRMIGDVPIRLAKSDSEIINFFRDNPYMTPAMAMFTPNKEVLITPAAIKDIQVHFGKRVEDSTLIIVVGLRLLEHDKHIWGKLAEAKAPIRYVAGEDDCAGFLKWSVDHSRSDDSVIGHRFADSLPAIISALAAAA